MNFDYDAIQTFGLLAVCFLRCFHLLYRFPFLVICIYGLAHVSKMGMSFSFLRRLRSSPEALEILTWSTRTRF